MNEIKHVAEVALSYWRSERDQRLNSHALSVEEVYKSGDFTSLPPECLMAVCYVDAYASVLANIDDIETRIG